MGCNHDTAGLLYDGAKAIGVSDAGHIAVEAEYDNVSEVRGHLHTHEEGQSGIAGEAFSLMFIPDIVVLGDATRAEAGGSGNGQQLLGFQLAIRTTPDGMAVEVEDGGRNV